MKGLTTRIGVAALMLAALLAAQGCGQSSAPAASAAPVAQPGASTPELMALFNTTCHACHAVPASGAPQVGDRAAWAPRLAQGRDVLLDHAISGYKSMPPMGGCTQCSEADFKALIEFMSGQSL